jgi:hypothetical protein
MRVMWPLPPGFEELDHLPVEAQVHRLLGPGHDRRRARPVGLEIALVLVQGDRPLEVRLRHGVDLGPVGAVLAAPPHGPDLIGRIGPDICAFPHRARSSSR